MQLNIVFAILGLCAAVVQNEATPSHNTQVSLLASSLTQTDQSNLRNQLLEYHFVAYNNCELNELGMAKLEISDSNKNIADNADRIQQALEAFINDRVIVTWFRLFVMRMVVCALLHVLVPRQAEARHLQMSERKYVSMLLLNPTFGCLVGLSFLLCPFNLGTVLLSVGVLAPAVLVPFFVMFHRCGFWSEYARDKAIVGLVALVASVCTTLITCWLLVTENVSITELGVAFPVLVCFMVYGAEAGMVWQIFASLEISYAKIQALETHSEKENV